ncbi:MAG: type I DNA topoisomerase [Chloroflexota bacterium]
MAKNLVIVESPAKAKTLARMLGRDFTLMASMGHVRDLPRSRLGVDVENGFTPQYVSPRNKLKIVREIKDAVKSAKTVYLATDPDREGEAISWHLAQVTQDGHDYKRVVFHEITGEAIKEAFSKPRDIDMKLVNAQQARRILDRLVGYKISPLLWKKVRRGLSAGRVQSVALRIIVDREREIQSFTPVEYWRIEAELAKEADSDKSFRALLIGLLDGTKLEIHSQKESDALVSALRKANYAVLKVARKKVTRVPAPPFITSTLQQEAWRKLRMSVAQTMAVAQELYEGLPLGKEGNTGLITYMRTDSTHVAQEALASTRAFIAEHYGKEFLPPRARVFTARVRGAQEAHEAIRPTSVKREPKLIREYLSPRQFRVYELIWKRMAASQMSALVLKNTTADVKARTGSAKDGYLLQAEDSKTVFPGFTILYLEGRDEAESKKASLFLPELKADDKLLLQDLFPEQRFTEPPPRFTEASLVRFLESAGIGRPSTYAPILSVIQERDYVEKNRGLLVPTQLGCVVSDLLKQNFPDIMDISFTAHMEGELDAIASKNRDWVEVVRNFYQPFAEHLKTVSETAEKVNLDEKLDELCPECGKPLVVKHGRFGKFIACSGYPECKYHRSFEVKLNVPCPECKIGEVVVKRGRKGRPFYGCNRYPECKFISSYRPLAQVCTSCGGTMTAYRDRQARCAKCGHIEPLVETESKANGARA